jgi:hypothetical protein
MLPMRFCDFPKIFSDSCDCVLHNHPMMVIFPQSNATQTSARKRTMTKTTAKLIASLEAELAAAVVSKDAANDAADGERFYAASDRVRDLEFEIQLVRQGKSNACNITRELVSRNID